jgi:type IV pilus assembly protein PilP
MMFSVSGCSESSSPLPQSNPVRTKIAATKKEAQKPDSNSSLPQATTAAQNQPEVKAPDETKEQEETGLVQESMQIAATYNPEGRFDPFEPLFKEEAEAQVTVASKGKRVKRTPQGPLERVALSQLKLSAIIRAPSGNRALVEDATGKGYVVEKGTYMGLNAGKVVLIDKDHLVVEEEIENVLGELTIQNTELKLQKPAGEL